MDGVGANAIPISLYNREKERNLFGGQCFLLTCSGDDGGGGCDDRDGLVSISAIDGEHPVTCGGSLFVRVEWVC